MLYLYSKQTPFMFFFERHRKRLGARLSVCILIVVDFSCFSHFLSLSICLFFFWFFVFVVDLTPYFFFNFFLFFNSLLWLPYYSTNNPCSSIARSTRKQQQKPAKNPPNPQNLFWFQGNIDRKGKGKKKKHHQPSLREKKNKKNKQNQNLFDTLSKTHLSSNWKGTLTFFFLFRTSLTTPQPSITLKCSQRIWFNLSTLWIFSCLGLPSEKQTKLWIFFFQTQLLLDCGQRWLEYFEIFGY